MTEENSNDRSGRDRSAESRQQLIRELREHYQSLSDVSLADELLRERREEARKEYAKLGIPFPENLEDSGR